MHPAPRLCAFAFFAILCPFTTHAATKNATDMSAFQGNFFGTAKVTAEGDTFRGRGRVHGRFAEDGLSGTFNLKATVRVDGERVPIDNKFVLKDSGRVSINELAPAVSDAKADGKFIAQSRTVEFDGEFDVGTVEGTFDCTASISSKGILRITYSVTIGDDTAPSFVYSFVVKAKKK